MVPYVVSAVVAVTVMRELLFVLDVIMLRECAGDDNAGVGDEGTVVVVSAGNEYVGGTRGSCIVSSAAEVLGVSVVRAKGWWSVCNVYVFDSERVWEVSG